ncbi:MAG: cytidine deaminase [Rhodothermaceae bacterium]|nr:cytidine deaminase [Rhodothermaceae bacterium]
MRPDVESLIDLATPLLDEITLARPDMSAATVAAAIRTRAGNIYTGVCIDVRCGMGFCAEPAAIAEMIKGRETEMAMVVAVCDEGVLAPCGRCREFMMQVSPKNLDADMVLPGGRTAPLRALLPDHWLTAEASKTG